MVVQMAESCTRGLKRKVSNHAALVLKEEVKDWGPKPFKFLSVWLQQKGFKERLKNNGRVASARLEWFCIKREA